jgi:hypothetical protein
MKKHYHVLHGMAGMYMPNVNHVATTKQEAWNIAQEELRNDREAGRKVSKVGKQEWEIVDGGTDYVCEVSSCFEADCIDDVSKYFSVLDSLGSS